MPTLANPKHELFAQGLAQGQTADEAYELAGYRRNRGNAARLNANESVLARIAELQAAAAVRTEVTIAGLTERLLGIADLAEDAAAVRAEDGEVLGVSTKHLTVARAALMDVAKLNGLVVDRAQTASSSLEDLLASLDARRGSGSSEGAGAGQPGAPEGGPPGVRAPPPEDPDKVRRGRRALPK